MSNLLSTIKNAARDAIEASNPVNLLMGVIKSEDPLEVTVDQRFTLGADFLIVPESLTRLVLDLRHTHQYTDSSDSGTANKNTTAALPVEPFVIRRGLEKGDKVLLLRIQGGQKFLVMDRVVG
ncbi:DUF2577 domain-containing protein [Paenibacillus sp. L3-i20]|uniref:DUF2577 domain-containing protein n=1 Tax=Paenibacillus sp. L3-i20 TaxID=2905833 RepID=UPI001EDFD686|nr:DUF2577 domain-containing protein [Paenibacillus sp. L3-i20]GKU79851.1 hypothetical protein L3i20_v242480 [Paenibacillus sp. L3-i20]